FHLLLYAAAAHAKNADLADKELKIAIAAYRDNGDSDERITADWLEGEKAPPADDVIAAVESPLEKRILLTAMSFRFPQDAVRYRAAAAHMNFERAFPYWTIKQLVEGAATAG